MTELRLAQAGLASQSKPVCIANNLTDHQRAAIAATMTAGGLATKATAEAVRVVVRDYYESQKAVVDDDDN